VTSILVTGGSGFIGRYMCERLVTLGFDVVILDLVRPSWPLGPMKFVQGDVRDAEAVRSVLHGCDEVIHLAAAHHDFGITKDTYFDVNEGGSRVLLAEMAKAGIRRVCFYSSVAVYGSAPEPRTEDVIAAPTSPYGASKLAGEEEFRRWALNGADRRALIIRPSVVFGPRNFANMFALVRQIHSGIYVPIGPGTNVKSLAYVENLIDATMMLRARTDAPAFDVYNYVDLPNLTSREICDTISEALGRRPASLALPLGVAYALAAPFDAMIHLTGRNLPISSARIKKLATMRTKFEAEKVRAAGFEPTVALREGIHRMARWFLDEGRRQSPQSHLPPERVGAVAKRARRAAGA